MATLRAATFDYAVGEIGKELNAFLVSNGKPALEREQVIAAIRRYLLWAHVEVDAVADLSAHRSGDRDRWLALDDAINALDAALTAIVDEAAAWLESEAFERQLDAYCAHPFTGGTPVPESLRDIETVYRDRSFADFLAALDKGLPRPDDCDAEFAGRLRDRLRQDAELRRARAFAEELRRPGSFLPIPRRGHPARLLLLRKMMPSGAADELATDDRPPWMTRSATPRDCALFGIVGGLFPGVHGDDEATVRDRRGLSVADIIRAETNAYEVHQTRGRKARKQSGED